MRHRRSSRPCRRPKVKAFSPAAGPARPGRAGRSGCAARAPSRRGRRRSSSSSSDDASEPTLRPGTSDSAYRARSTARRAPTSCQRRSPSDCARRSCAEPPLRPAYRAVGRAGQDVLGASAHRRQRSSPPPAACTFCISSRYRSESSVARTGGQRSLARRAELAVGAAGHRPQQQLLGLEGQCGADPLMRVADVGQAGDHRVQPGELGAHGLGEVLGGDLPAQRQRRPAAGAPPHSSAPGHPAGRAAAAGQP